MKEPHTRSAQPRAPSGAEDALRVPQVGVGQEGGLGRGLLKC